MLHRFKFKTAFLITLFTPVGYNTLLANFTPPPPEISNINNIGLYGNWVLWRDQVVDNIVKSAGDFYDINLNGHLITVGSGGINSIGSGQLVIHNGWITSTDGQLRLSSSSYHLNQLDINAVICDSPTHKVGLRVSGAIGAYRLMGNNPNTFTGDVEVIGKGQYFALAKNDGVTAVLGNIYVKDGAMVGVDNSNQISDSSTVMLSGERSGFGLFETGRPLVEYFHKLAVNSFDDGVLLFGHKNDSFEKSLFLDNLEIGVRASLNIEGWMAGRDHLFIKKSDGKLEDTLTKVRFKGKSGAAGVRDYNNDYWEIGVGAGFRPLPEPTTYGAAFSVVALALWAFRCRKRHVPLTAGSRT